MDIRKELLGAIALCVAVVGPASASILDQSNEAAHTAGGSLGTLGASFDINWAQTFDVGRTGQLTSVDVDLFVVGTPTEPLTLDIRPLSGFAPELTAANSLGSLTLLPNEVFTGWQSFDLTAENIFVTQGQQLALVLDSAQDFTLNVNQYGLRFSEGDSYAGGQLWDQFNGAAWGNTFGEPTWDLRFRTFVTPEPATVILLAAGGLAMTRRRRSS